MNQKIIFSKLVRPAWSYVCCVVLFLVLFFTNSQEARATHVAGADIAYTCLGSNEYIVTLRVYRDCDGINMQNSENVTLSSVSCGLNPADVTLTLDTFYEVSSLCPLVLASNSCSSPGAPTYPGHQVWIYSGVLTFPQTCSDWVVSWTDCCRNTAAGGPLLGGSIFSNLNRYIQAMINSNYCNSSAKFGLNLIPYFSAGECYQYNQSAFDPEGDTLFYALTCPLEATGTCLAHNVGYSPTQPIITNPAGSFLFDSNTGQMNFCTPPGQAQYGPVVTTIYNIVSGDTIGYVQRDIDFIVLTNLIGSSPPTSTIPTVFAGGVYLPPPHNIFEVCEGETLIFDQIMNDPDGDTITLNSVTTNLDAVFGAGNWTTFFNTVAPYRPDSVQIFVQVVTTVDHIGRNVFTVGVTDNACPLPQVLTQSYIIDVIGAEAVASEDILCPAVAQQVQLTAEGGSVVGSYSWTQIMGPAVTFSDDTIANPIINIPSTTVDGDSIVLHLAYVSPPSLTTWTQCVTTDQVTLYFVPFPLTLDLLASDTSLCPNGQSETISLSTSTAENVNMTNGAYTWSASPASYLANLSNNSIGNPNAILSGAANDSVTYTVSYVYGLCSGAKDIQLKWKKGLPSLIATSDTICFGDTTQLMAVLTDTLINLDTTACYTYTVDSIPFAPLNGAGTIVPLANHTMSTVLPIGFDFDFYCNTYSDFRISSDGFIAFGTATIGSTCCSGLVLPSTSFPDNLIALGWGNLEAAAGGTIEYYTVGIAPNRQLVVDFSDIPRALGTNISVQLVLHEGTNYIDIHSDSVPGGNPLIMTQGIENIDGTIGVAIPGRNGTVWSAANDAYRFRANPTVLFDPITYTWTPSPTVLDTTASSTSAFPQETTTYNVAITQGSCVLEDSITIINGSLAAPTINSGVVANPMSSVLFEWGQVLGALSWEYSTDSVNWVGVPIQDSSLFVGTLASGACVNIWVRAIGGIAPCTISPVTYLEICSIDTSVSQNGLGLRAGASGPTITYQWVDCNNGNAPIIGATNQDFTPTVTGSYAVIVNDGANSIMSPCTSVIVLDMDKLITNFGVVFYPNPTSSLLYVEKNDNSTVQIRITDNMGRLLYFGSSNKLKTALDMTEYPSGIYFISLSNEEATATQKVVKE